MREDLTEAWGGCSANPVWVSVSGVTVMKMVSSEATVTWIPLDTDSSDFLVNVWSVWLEL